MSTAWPEVPERARWLLLALNAAGVRGLTPVRLQKSLFVFGRRAKIPLGTFYDFEPYHYGPFDVQVYRDAEALADLDLIAIGSANSSLRTFRLTSGGRKQAEEIAQRLPSSAVEFLRAVVDWTQRLSFSSLVRAVYEAFPEMSANSVFRDAS